MTYRDQQNSTINFFHTEHETNLCHLFCFQKYFFKAYYVSTGEKKKDTKKEKAKNKRNLIAYTFFFFQDIQGVCQWSKINYFFPKWMFVTGVTYNLDSGFYQNQIKEIK